MKVWILVNDIVLLISFSDGWSLAHGNIVDCALLLYPAILLEFQWRKRPKESRL